MHYNVPQFIDVEDTVVGPLSAKQILWIFALGAVILIMWATISSKALFIIIAIPVVVLFIALAFYKPNGKPFIDLIKHILFFSVKPKIYVWKRDDDSKKAAKKHTSNDDIKKNKSQKDVPRREDIVNLAKILDSESDILGR